MNYRTEILALAALAAVASWASHAPAAPLAHAQYLCRPLRMLVEEAALAEAALSDADQVVPPEHPWLPEIPRGCVRAVLRLSSDAGA